MSEEAQHIVRLKCNECGKLFVEIYDHEEEHLWLTCRSCRKEEDERR